LGNAVQELTDYLINSFSESGRLLRSHVEPALSLDDHEPFMIGHRTDVVHRESGLAANSDQSRIAWKPGHRLIRNDEADKPSRNPGLVSHASSRTGATR
jgi:hypothetical protein